MSRGDLKQAVGRWIEACTGAPEAADWLIERAGRNGQLPYRVRIDRKPEIERPLTALVSDRFIAGRPSGPRYFRLGDYDVQVFGEPGGLVHLLAQLRGRVVENRRAAAESLQHFLTGLIAPYATAPGLVGAFAHSTLSHLARRKGRLWRRSSAHSADEVARAIRLHVALLRHVEDLACQPGTVERLADVSRAIAGDTHWLRPGNEAWRDLSDDLIDLMPARETAAEPRTPECRAAVLRDAGLVENLTSITVLVFGRVAVRCGDRCWRWLEEAAADEMPLWLSAAHLEGALFESPNPISRVVAVENETSFHDLIALLGKDRCTVLVLTAGHANRAVIKTLQLLKQAFPAAAFGHQGDLDLAGVRILESLQRRCGFHIAAERMDRETHRRFRQRGIALDERQREELRAALAREEVLCRDLLEEVLEADLRIEQENVTEPTWQHNHPTASECP